MEHEYLLEYCYGSLDEGSYRIATWYFDVEDILSAPCELMNCNRKRVDLLIIRGRRKYTF